MFARLGFAVAFFILAVVGTAQAQGAPIAAPPPAPIETSALPPIVEPVETLDAEKATNAYLATVRGEARAKSDSYFEGGYWLLLADAIYALAVAAILLWGKLSAWMRNSAVKVTFVVAFAFAALFNKLGASDGLRNGTIKFFTVNAWKTAIYGFQYVILTTVLTFPLTVYEAFFREHQYGLSNQNFGQWFGDFTTDFVLDLIVTMIALIAIYAVIRRAKKMWWVWGTVVALAFMTVGMVIAPVYIAPLFNTYKAMPESPLRDQVLSLARANGIPATNVYVFDASKQTKRISANVSGLFGTTRISLNDNLLNRSNQREILAVLGHEMGHYVLDHAVRLLMMMGLVFLVGFAFAAWAFGWLTVRYGAAWGVMGIDDIAGLPVLMAIATFYLLVATPVTNTITRTTEAQADIFGLNAARQPDGFSQATLQLSEYRKLDPTPLEEVVFYDHPSGRSRISMSMRWKAEHMNDPDIKAGPKSPQ